MNLPCDCCQGPQVLTPARGSHRFGLRRLHYRAGTYASFFSTMQARLSSRDYPELAALKTREPGDPAIALLDAWACTADVLTFYQERIANEGYLRTATERRSVLELARLVGYALRPGASATAYLAYTLDRNADAPVTIPAGARANSVPGPGETMQAFETAEDLQARRAWNNLQPRLSQPQTPSGIKANGLYLNGTATRLKANQPLLIDWGNGKPQLLRIASVEEDSTLQRTRVLLQQMKQGTQTDGEEQTEGEGKLLGGIIDALLAPPSLPPASARQLGRSVAAAYGKGSDAMPHLLTALQPRLKQLFYASWQAVPPRVAQPVRVYALRVAAAPFGHNAPLRQVDFDETHKRAVFDEWLVSDPWNGTSNDPPPPGLAAAAFSTPEHHEPGKLFLDNEYDLAPDSWIAIEKADGTQIVTKARLHHRSFTGYGLSGKTVQVDLPDGAAWLADDDDDYSPVRRTQVHAGSELLELAEEPITDPVKGQQIELGTLVEDLTPGRWLIVSGERSDVHAGGKPVPGMRVAELAMLAGITQGVRQSDGRARVGDTTHTMLNLSDALAYAYKRDTVTIYGNVVKASNGASCGEVLGAGNAAQPLQQFTLRQPPLTYVSAPTTSGVASTLEVRVGDVAWHETDSLAALGPQDRKYITRNDDDGKTTVIFGNGVHGARLPTGLENVKASYRNGIGRGGNVRAGQVSLLQTRPLGVLEVRNPLRASGGADREDRDQARKNTPLALLALDRLVSTSDYADFSRTFGGVAKASAARLSDGHQQRVHVTIAGADDEPIELTSDLYRNLFSALHRYGDPWLAVTLALRERLALVVSAHIRVAADYRWDDVEPQVRAAMLAAFGFERVELAQDLLLADAVATMQGVRGVEWVDVDVFDTIDEQAVLAGFDKAIAAQLALRARIRVLPAQAGGDGPKPAQLAYLSPDVPDTLILQEVQP